MRSRRAVIGGVVSALVVSAALGGAALAGEDAAADPAGSPSRPLVVGAATGAGVILHRDGVTDDVNGAVPAPDGSRLVRPIVLEDTTRIEWVRPASGRVTTSVAVPGSYRIGAVSADARRVALVPSALTAVGSAPAAGRRTTPFVIVTSGGAEPRRVEVVGNLEPEAFTTDGQSLFVAQYEPPLAPVAYQVRRLDLRSGKVHDVRDIHGEGREPMPGAARAHVYSPDGGRLYTFYAVADAESGPRGYAFVHVLDLDEGWAHCVPLPAPFGVVPDDAVAITAAPDGSRVYVVDHTTRSIAAIDTERLESAERGRLPIDEGRGPITATVSPRGTVFVAAGTRVTGLDVGDEIRRSAVFDAASDVVGLQAEPSGIYVRSVDQVDLVDPGSGARLRSWSAPAVGSDPLRGGPGAQPDAHGSYQCAC